MDLRGLISFEIKFSCIKQKPKYNYLSNVGQTGNMGLKELLEDVNENSDLLPGHCL